MCGISVIISGIHLDLSTVVTKSIDPSSQSQQPLLSIEDIEAALRRRGPDSLGKRRIFLQANEGDLCLIEREVEVEKDLQDNDQINNVADFSFIGATLQLRGTSPIVQPLVDAFGNILVYNGEIFGGLYVGSDRNDGEVLMESLRKSSCSHEDMRESNSCVTNGKSVVDILSTIKGPWALIYWQACSKTLWFGRDAFGRRSLLVHWPDSIDSRLLLSSVAPSWSCKYTHSSAEESEINFWEELPCGIYSVRMNASNLDAKVTGQVKIHEWANPMVHELIRWERTMIQPKCEDLIRVPTPLGQVQASVQLPSKIVLHVLREAVMRRSAINEIFKAPKKDYAEDRRAPVGVLFSGGLDSMILAALLNDCLDPKYEIDLLNVSFDSSSAPDRISARAGVKELAGICPLRRWNLVEIDAELSKLTGEMKHVMSLINPSMTFMDINIGLALWFAAAGEGYIYDEEYSSRDCNDNGEKRYFKSDSRILLVGSGADEQCAGYGRHRTKYRNSSWVGLHKEMKLDMQRIWKRNLGRDDRCIADHGKEARFPFLDEDVIMTLLKLPLWEITDLDQPSGKGDKKILREVAHLLGLHEASVLPKRAIQFGSRISRESNRKNFGSNRAANQASAGSAEVFRHSNRS